MNLPQAPAGGAGLDADHVIVRFALPPVACCVALPQRARPGGRLDRTLPLARSHVAALEAQHRQFRRWLAAHTPRAVIVREYQVVFNGVALRLNGASADALATAPHVERISPVRFFQPSLNVSHRVVAAPSLWRALGGHRKAGAGIKVGLIDSGIDHTHPFFYDPHLPAPAGFPRGDTRFTSNKVIVAKVFHRDPKMTAAAVHSHGTHVAGAIAGVRLTRRSQTGLAAPPLTGIAPKAYLGNYNVFPGDSGSASEEAIIAAVEEAVIDGMDVINMSLGGQTLGDADPLSEAVDGAVEAGVVVVVSAGNRGPGEFTVGSPGIAAGAITMGLA